MKGLMKNEIIIDNNICTMHLYNREGRKIRETVFDIEFLEEVKKYNRWSAYKHRNTYYVVTNLTKEQQEIHNKTRLKLHKLILPCEKPRMIDHKDHDGLNNMLYNLEIVTNRKNCENRGARSNKHGYVGIHYHKRDKAYCGAIQIDGKNYHTGNFKTAKEAHEAREQFKLDKGL